MPALKDVLPYVELDEERDLKEYEVWCCDLKDCIPALKPIEIWAWWRGPVRSMPHGTDFYQSPMRTPDWRSKDGFIYLTGIKLSDEEKRRREPIFRERIAPWIDNFEAVWRGKYAAELDERFRQLTKVDLATLGDGELRAHLDDWDRYYARNWDVHFIGHYGAWPIYGLFEDMCKELLGMDEGHPQFKALLSGFDNRLYEVDRGLYRLGSRAMELGLAKTFEAVPDDEELLKELEKIDAGRQWLAEFRRFLVDEKKGYRTPRVFDLSTPTWIQKPTQALPTIRMAIARGGAFALDQERERLVKQRAETEKEVLGRIPLEKREWFGKLMESAQWIGRYNEEHQIPCEFYANGWGRHLLAEIGKRFAGTGVIEEPEDVLFLLPDEIATHLVSAGLGKFSVRKLVQIRKDQYQQNLKTEPPIFIGDMDKVGGVVTEELILLRVVAGMPIVKPELKADLYGSNSSPGVAEGTARVIFGAEEFHLVQPGEILVAPATAPPWTPLFGVVAGVVGDSGGALSHAVIIGREFGIPAVVGTMEATRKIKTGDRVRVDGNNGCVYILG